jgi:hypothetical protein
MKKLTKLFSIAITIVFFFVTNTYSQYENSICGDSDSPPLAFGIPHLTPDEGEYFKVLILYVAFSDDTLSGPDWNVWERSSQPVNPYTDDGRFIDTKEMSDYTDYTYSKWFQEMSLNQFDFIGDEVYVQLDTTAEYYQSLNYTFGQMNNVVLQHADALVNFSDYDNWKIDNGEWVMEMDGNVDFVIINYRRVPGLGSWFHSNSGMGGIATLGTSITLQGLNVSNGVTALGLLNRLTRTQVIVLHEVGHWYFGHTSLGLMTPAHGHSTYHMSPHEREYIGYINPTIPSSSAPSGTYTLRDYIIYGDVLKIQIPNTSEYFYVANHQKFSMYDGLARGSNACWNINRIEQDPYCDKNKGLYIYHSSASNCINNSWLGYQNGNQFRFYRPMDIENAEGKFNWEVDRYVSVPELSGTYPIFKTIQGNRETGRDEYGKYVIDLNFAVILNNIECGGSPDFSITWDAAGDESDAYNIGYDEIFSPYSNPASNSCNNPTANTGITIKLHSQNQQTGAITLYVYFDDELALADLPPSKPKNVKVTEEWIDQRAGSFHPKITWDANIEPDFIDLGEGDPRYKVYRGISSVCENEPTYYFVANTYTNEFVDENSVLYNGQHGSGICTYQYRAYSYKISAVDNTDMESLKSEKGMITGFIDPCAPQWAPGNITLKYDPLKPESFSIKNFPNPFNPLTKIQFDLPHDVFVSIKIYDITGREIATLVNEFKEAGYYITSFDGARLSSGVYYYKIKAGSFESVKKMILLK